MRSAAGRSGGPVVVGANVYSFTAGEQIYNRQVDSVCLVWVLDGHGTIRSSSTDHELTRSSVLWLPWRHDVRYVAAGVRPFRIGTVHLIPWHADDVDLVPRAAHHMVEPRPSRTRDPLLDVEHRRGDPGQPVPVDPREPIAGRLAQLGEYAVGRFQQGQIGAPVLRDLGRLLHEEFQRSIRDESDPRPIPPVTLQAMQHHVMENLGERLTVADIAAAGDCSPSTAERLFLRWTETTVLAWATSRRMERAASLLTTTGLRVGEVARRVGFADQNYFSRVFSRTFGMPPSQFSSGRIRP